MSLETPARPAGAIDVMPDVPLPPWPAHWRSLPRSFVHQARARPKAPALADSTGASLTYGETFLRSLVLGRVLARELGPEPYVGLLIPPTAPGGAATHGRRTRAAKSGRLRAEADHSQVDRPLRDTCGSNEFLNFGTTESWSFRTWSGR